jgi:Flp pilus assembly protein TadG
MTDACKLLHRLGRDQRGVIAVIFAIMFPVVAGILALGIETGIWYGVKRHNQAIADVAAYSAALEIAGGNPANAVTAAETDAKTNGFDFANSANTGSTVTVATSGPTTSTVTVTLKHQQTPLILRYFLGNNTFTIANQAVAQASATNACLAGVGGPNSGTFLLVGSFLGTASVTMPDCTITSDSTSSSSIEIFNLFGDSTITAHTIYTAGGIQEFCFFCGTQPPCGGPGITLTVPATCNATALPDPYANVNPPTMPAMPASVTTFPTLATPPGPPSAQSVNAPAAPSSRTKPSLCSAAATVANPPSSCYSASSVTISAPVTFGTKFTGSIAGTTLTVSAVASGGLAVGDIVSGSGVAAGTAIQSQLTGVPGLTGTYKVSASQTVSSRALAVTTYYFAGSVTINSNGTANIGDGAALYLATGNLMVNSGGTASFAAVSSAASPTSIYVNNGSITSLSGGAVSFTGTGSSAYSLKASGGFTLAGTTAFGPADYAFYSGNLALNGCTVFKPGTATLDVVNGNLSTSGSGGVYFNPNGLTCSTTYTSAASTYALQVQSGGLYTFGSAATDPASFGPAAYGFNNGSVTLNGTATFAAGTTNVNIANGNLITAATSTLNFTGNSASKYAFVVQSSGGSYTIGGKATFNGGSPTAPFYALYNGGLTASPGSTVSLAPANYYLDSGSLALNGCAAIQSGTSSINVKAGNLTSSATGNITFIGNPPPATVTACGVSYITTTSQYTINTGSGNGVTLGSPAAFNAGTYYFRNSAGGGTGVAINGGTSGSPITLAGGIYSVENGNFSIGSGANATFAAGTTGTLCAPSGSASGSCIYVKNGGFSNAGKITFGAGTIYFYDGSGGFTSSGTATGALTFTGGDSSGSPSTYYFYNGGTNGALNIADAANAAFGPATYYIVNGNLVIHGDQNSSTTLTCPGCTPGGGGAGDTFVLTQTATGGSIGTAQIGCQGCGITATLAAPGGGPYPGLVLFQDRNAAFPTSNFFGCATNCNTFEGGNAMDMTGAIYLPKGSINFLGFLGQSSGNCLVIFADQVTLLGLLGTASLTSNGCPAIGVKTIGTYQIALTQ